MDIFKYTIDANGCWVFDNAKNKKGYGVKRYKGKNWQAHRLQWTLHNGPIPKGFQVCHRCDNPPCINLDHLWLGTNADNHRDKVAKGRHMNQNTHATHCKRGHEFTEENTRLYRGKRHCRECMKDYMRERRANA